MPSTSQPQDRLERFARSHRSALVAQARRVLGDADQAEDVVQETLAALWRRLAAEPIDDLPRYAARAVRLNALRHRARWRAWQPLELDVPAPASDRAAPPPVTPAELERALRRLPPAQQAVVRMRFYAGLSFRQIGQVLRISLNTAASRCRYGLENLRRQLRARDGDQT